MASTMIHMAVASEINKVIKKDNDILLIGSISPDLSKQLGQKKTLSHFLDSDDTNIPNMDKFLDKYRSKLNDDFVLGYYIHLYTDYLWFKYFLPEVYDSDKNLITKLDGSVVKCNDKMMCMYMYNDYTNLNIRLLDEYDMNLAIFYKDIPHLNNIIEEIPMDKIKVIIDKASVIIENTKEHKDYLFNIENIKEFIDMSVKLTLSKLEELNII